MKTRYARLDALGREGSLKQTVGILTKQAKNSHGGESLQIWSGWPHICHSCNLQHVQCLLAKETQLSQTHYFLGRAGEGSHLWQIFKLKRLRLSCRFCHNFTALLERSAHIFIQLSNNWNSSHIITQMAGADSAARKLGGPVPSSESKCHKCHINLRRVTCGATSKCFI